MSADNVNNASACPVKQQPVEKGKKSTKTSDWSPLEWFQRNYLPTTPTATKPSIGDCPVQHDGKLSATHKGGGCPVKHDEKLPASIEEAANHSQAPLPDQRYPLSTHREVSSIPRADDLAAAASHQPKTGEDKNWVYPSQQQIYNAMRRKGYEVEESTIPMVIQIHNSVNERSWNLVKRWERELHGVEEPRLVTILGRPDKLSPKAMFQTYVLQKEPPFDRHDWCVDRGDGVMHRYIIDFYGRDSPVSDNGIPSMALDVRPALDSPGAALDRMHMALRDVFPSIFAVSATRRLLSPRLSSLSKKTDEKKEQNSNQS